MATSRALNVPTKDSTSTACRATYAVPSANKATSAMKPARTITPSSNYTSYGIQGSTLFDVSPAGDGLARLMLYDACTGSRTGGCTFPQADTFAYDEFQDLLVVLCHDSPAEHAYLKLRILQASTGIPHPKATPFDIEIDTDPMEKDISLLNGSTDPWSYAITVCGSSVCVSRIFIERGTPKRYSEFWALRWTDGEMLLRAFQSYEKRRMSNAILLDEFHIITAVRDAERRRAKVIILDISSPSNAMLQLEDCPRTTFLLPQAQRWDYFRITLTCQPRPTPLSEGSHPNSVAKVDIQMNLLGQPPASFTLLVPNAVLKSFPAGQSVPWATWHPKTRFVMNSHMTGHCIGVSGTRVLSAQFLRLVVWNFDKTSRKRQAKTTVNDDIWRGEIVTSAPYDELTFPDLALCDYALPLLAHDCILVPKAFKDASGLLVCGITSERSR